MPYLSTQWKDIFYVQIAYYAIILGCSFSLFLRLLKFSRDHGGKFNFLKLQIYAFLLPILKIVGAACAVVTIDQVNDLKDPQEGLVIVSIMFNTISVGFLMNMLIAIIRHLDSTDTVYIEDIFKMQHDIEVSEGEYTYKEDSDKENNVITSSDSKYYLGIIEKRLDTLVTVANILVIAGSSTATSDISTAKLLIIASASIFLVCAVIISFMVFKKYTIMKSTYNRVDEEFGVAKILLFLPFIIPFLLVRIIYSICSGVGFKGYDLLDVSHISKFAIIFGDWKYYLGLGFVEECMIILGIIFIGHLIDHKR